MIEKVKSEIRKKNSVVVVGLDPYIERIPQHIVAEQVLLHGKTIKAICEAIFSFNCEVVDMIHDLVVAVKPQIAFYEIYGVEGIQCFIKTIQYAKSKGLIVIGDCKRGDIGSTSEAYAKAHIGKLPIFEECQSMFDEDYVTVNPYLGSDGILPFVKECQLYNKGIFVLVKTSNPSSGELQNVLTIKQEPLYMKVVDMVKQFDLENNVGVVVGATYPNEAKKIRKQLPQTLFLVPGYGTQGASGEMLKNCFDENGEGALVCASRSILYAFEEEKEYLKDIYNATLNMRNDLNQVRKK